MPFLYGAERSAPAIPISVISFKDISMKRLGWFKSPLLNCRDRYKNIHQSFKELPNKKTKMSKYLIYVTNFGVPEPNEKSNAKSPNENP